MIKWAVKKYLVGKVNDLLAVNETNVSATKEIVAKWIARIDKILSCLKSMLSKLDDNKIDAEELEQCVEEIEETVKAW